MIVPKENAMKTIREIYRIGRGPSSSHTMGPEAAAKLFTERTPAATDYKVILYGSLALTGKGHGTDVVLCRTFPKPVEIVYDTETPTPYHPNTLDLFAYRNGEEVLRWRVYSVGGGAIEIEGEPTYESPDIYPLTTFSAIKAYCEKKEITLWQYVEECEGAEIWDYLNTVWDRMQRTIREGLVATGTLPGGLNVERKARILFQLRHIDESPETRESRLICAYAYATSEQNADGQIIVTAPTCGASGVLPAVLKYMSMHERKEFSTTEILRALAVAGLIGNLIKTNASISGADCGCQAEIGSACSMAAAALASLHGLEIDQIEYAAEVAMEHHLGLTCDPVYGLVQIPCIERNAVAAMRALNALHLADFLTYTRKISFDMVIETMRETGRDLSNKYRETGEGGLAKLYNKR